MTAEEIISKLNESVGMPTRSRLRRRIGFPGETRQVGQLTKKIVERASAFAVESPSHISGVYVDRSILLEPEANEILEEELGRPIIMSGDLIFDGSLMVEFYFPDYGMKIEDYIDCRDLTNGDQTV